MANFSFTSFTTIQLFNVLAYIWFTFTNVFAFTLAFGWRDFTPIDPPDQWKYGYGIGKETYLTPAPWIYIVLLVVHLLFLGTIGFAQFYQRGRDVVVGGLGYRWPALMVLSVFWTATWVRQWYYTSWVFSVAVAVLAVETNRTMKRRYRLQYEVDFKDEVFLHIPFSFYEAWAILILFINTFATFAPVSHFAGLASRIFAVWFIILISGLAFLSSFSYTTGDVPQTLVFALGQLAIFVHQLNRENTNHQHLIAWFAFAFGIITVWAVAYSSWLTVHVVRHGAGSIRLAEDGGNAEEHA